MKNNFQKKARGGRCEEGLRPLRTFIFPSPQPSYDTKRPLSTTRIAFASIRSILFLLIAFELKINEKLQRANATTFRACYK